MSTAAPWHLPPLAVFAAAVVDPGHPNGASAGQRSWDPDAARGPNLDPLK